MDKEQRKMILVDLEEYKQLLIIYGIYQSLMVKHVEEPIQKKIIGFRMNEERN